VNDDAVCVKGGKGPNAHTLPQNGPGEDILIENCTFGDSHGTLTLGSECVHADKITIRNCKMDNHAPILRLKMRPDTYQLYENITVENITGSCGTIIEMLPWKQFFYMAGSNAKPFGTVRNISFSNINVKCKSFGVMQGNPLDVVSSVSFKNITATCDEPALKSKYKGVKVEKVKVNGKPLVVQ
jgi:polygalacturonase